MRNEYVDEQKSRCEKYRAADRRNNADTGKKSHAMVSVTVVVLLLVPATLIASEMFGSRKYYIVSVLIIIYSMIPFFLSFERRKPQARELVMIAVMCAIAVISRAAFAALPSFKPMTGIVMITAMVMGPQVGFMTGALSAFVSNFVFGQGPWTPWQMFALGLAGYVAGFLARKGILKSERRLLSAVFGGLFTLLVVGPILDTCTFFMMSSVMNKMSAAVIYFSGISMNVVHAAATFLTMFVLCRPVSEKLDRIKTKYGMMEDNR